MDILFLPNDHLLMWLPSGLAVDCYDTAYVRPAAFARVIERGEWGNQQAFLRCLLNIFTGPPDLTLHARALDALVTIYPSAPLIEKVRIRPAPESLTIEQRAILRLMAQGYNTGQIAHRIHRRRRWVLLQIARIKRAFGAQSRAQALGKGKR